MGPKVNPDFIWSYLPSGNESKLKGCQNVKESRKLNVLEGGASCEEGVLFQGVGAAQVQGRGNLAKYENE